MMPAAELASIQRHTLRGLHGSTLVGRFSGAGPNAPFLTCCRIAACEPAYVQPTDKAAGRGHGQHADQSPDVATVADTGRRNIPGFVRADHPGRAGYP